jgi:HD superfamily phosphohydrolase
MPFQRQRIRDPLHNLIEFRADQFENAMWDVVQTRPFQRLRRVKQLGFSELVYPGATHTRFAHSIGVFHTARQLLKIIQSGLGENRHLPHQANVALAAALVHDLGHGPFSHAFEDVGKRLRLKMAHHERLSSALIREGDVSGPLGEMGSGFAADVADLIASSRPKNVYSALISSQFDADRLDYMRRDRLMTGTHHGAIDFEWLLSNIEIGDVPYGSDTESVGTVQTFVLGSKAIYAAESYLLGLFQLYPTVYFHKTTRGAEKLFSEVLYRTITLVQDGWIQKTGLPGGHPLIRFALDPENTETILNLDDSVIWGALSMMSEAEDRLIANFSLRLRDRKLFRCHDVRERLAHSLGEPPDSEALEQACLAVEERVEEWLHKHPPGEECPRILVDHAERKPYKLFEESKGPLNQINLKMRNGKLVDVARLSSVVRSIETLKIFRLYTAREDDSAGRFVESTISEWGSKH